MSQTHLFIGLVLFALVGCAGNSDSQGDSDPTQEDRDDGARSPESEPIPITPEPSFEFPTSWPAEFKGKTLRLVMAPGDPNDEEEEEAFRAAFNEAMGKAGCFRMVSSGGDWTVELKLKNKTGAVSASMGIKRRDISAQLSARGTATLKQENLNIAVVHTQKQITTMVEKSDLSVSNSAAVGRVLANKLLAHLPN